MQYTRVIVAQVERVGYLCSQCNRFHRPTDRPVYVAHLVSAIEGLTFYTETHAYGIDATGKAVRLPASLGLAVMAGAEPVEG